MNKHLVRHLEAPNAENIAFVEVPEKVKANNRSQIITEVTNHHPDL